MLFIFLLIYFYCYYTVIALESTLFSQPLSINKKYENLAAPCCPAPFKDLALLFMKVQVVTGLFPYSSICCTVSELISWNHAFKA